ncbi:MAG: nicotinate-nucleotide--dimethylbenzimidazole phosphoribosyltransferase [Geminicoccaceae bacterium]
MTITQVKSPSELLDAVRSAPAADDHARRVAAERQDVLTKPPGSLGRLEEIALWLCAWQGSARPSLAYCQAIVFAGNHGVAERGVSAFPPAVTEQMVANFEAGGAAINQLCMSVDAKLDVHALDLDRPTADFSKQPAMSSEACLVSVNRGIGAVDPDADMLLLGEMGIGNTTVAAAICCGLFGHDPSEWVGRGTGIDDSQLAFKAELIRTAMSLHGDALNDPLAVLSMLGGREQAAIFGATLAARHHRIPVILDGYVCTAAAAPLEKLSPGALDHCLVGHVSAEPGHQRLLTCLQKKPLLNLNMRLGEGSGAAVAFGIVRCAAAAHNGMATFAEAGVADG